MLIQEYRNSSNEVYIVSMGFTLMCSHFTSNCLDFFIWKGVKGSDFNLDNVPAYGIVHFEKTGNPQVATLNIFDQQIFFSDQVLEQVVSKICLPTWPQISTGMEKSKFVQEISISVFKAWNAKQTATCTCLIWYGWVSSGGRRELRRADTNLRKRPDWTALFNGLAAY